MPMKEDNGMGTIRSWGENKDPALLSHSTNTQGMQGVPTPQQSTNCMKMSLVCHQCKGEATAGSVLNQPEIMIHSFNQQLHIFFQPFIFIARAVCILHFCDYVVNTFPTYRWDFSSQEEASEESGFGWFVSLF